MWLPDLQVEKDDEDDYITISQDCGAGEITTVMIHRRQVPLLKELLDEAQAEGGDQ